MPEMTVWLVAGSVLALNVGSSRISLPSTSPSLSRSPPDSGSIDMLITVSGNAIAS